MGYLLQWRLTDQENTGALGMVMGYLPHLGMIDQRIRGAVDGDGYLPHLGWTDCYPWTPLYRLRRWVCQWG